MKAQIVEFADKGASTFVNSSLISQPVKIETDFSRAQWLLKLPRCAELWFAQLTVKNFVW